MKVRVNGSRSKLAYNLREPFSRVRQVLAAMAIDSEQSEIKGCQSKGNKVPPVGTYIAMDILNLVQTHNIPQPSVGRHPQFFPTLSPEASFVTIPAAILFSPPKKTHTTKGLTW